MTPRHIEIIRHSLGLKHPHGTGEMYRNHFCAGAKDVVSCRELVALGLMDEHGPTEGCGGHPLFTVTDKGKALAR